MVLPVQIRCYISLLVCIREQGLPHRKVVELPLLLDDIGEAVVRTARDLHRAKEMKVFLFVRHPLLARKSLNGRTEAVLET